MEKNKISLEDKIKLENMLGKTSDKNLSYNVVINNITLDKLDVHKDELIKLIEDSKITFEEAIDWIQFINTPENVPNWNTLTGDLETKLIQIKNKAATTPVFDEEAFWKEHARGDNMYDR